MEVWLEGSGNRRVHTGNGFSLKPFSPRFASKENPDDLVLASSSVRLTDANGYWEADAFLSRNEVSALIDFLISDDKTFPELVDKVFARLRQQIEPSK